MPRSFLFVPADSEKKLAKALDIPADALILDLEDAVDPAMRPRARELAREFLEASTDTWVRINPLDSDDAPADLEAVVPGRPAGIMLPKPPSADAAVRLAAMLDRLEDQHGIRHGSTRILPLVTEHPRALFTLDSYIGSTTRLAGLSWGAEDLAAAVGASTNRDADGRWLPTFELARSLCLVAAAAAHVPAYDTVYTDFRNEPGLREYAANARRDGFAGMLAIHPAQVAVINEAFTPDAAEINRARRIVELFAANPEAGALSLNGQMIDRPHLVQAERLLAMVETTES
ncbi:MAG: CoA ester lyase [Woeseiaceae bacterium]|jgi:citrate lyase subunit beta/citryl-CoA lyase|nr:CoA ester lyase [Woeseiaceae bacterium]